MPRKPEYDEVAQFGPLFLARKGTHTVFRNLSTPEEHQARMEQLADSYESLVGRISDDVAEIRALLATLEPTLVLHRAYWQHLGAHLGLVAEAQVGPDQSTAQRLLDYVQSVYAATHLDESRVRPPTDDDFERLRSLVERVFVSLSASFPIAQSAHRQRTDPDYSREVDEVFVTMVLYWCAVRGDRYPSHDGPHLRRLLGSHDAAIRRAWRITSEDICAGLESIRASLSRGVGEAMEDLHAAHENVIPFLDDPGPLPDIDPEDQEAVSRVARDLADRAGETERIQSAAARLYGLQLFDVAELTGWPDDFIADLSWECGDCEEFFADGEFAGWPIRRWPVMERPFLRVRGRSYCFDQLTVFDYVYRVIESAIVRREPTYREAWNKKQKAVSEAIPVELFLELFPDARHLAPAWYDTPSGRRETDGVLEFGGFLFVLEVRAGAFSKRPPSKGLYPYAQSLSRLLGKPINQAYELIDELDRVGEVQLFDRRGGPAASLTRSSYRHVIPVAVSLDNLGVFQSRASKLAPFDQATYGRPVWSLSIDDLRVLRDLFDNSATFCHYVEQRWRAAQEALPVLDEVDHIGLYLKHNRYVDYAQELNLTVFHGYQEPVDRYYHAVGLGEQVDPPSQDAPDRLRQILRVLAGDPRPTEVRAVCALLDLNTAGRQMVHDGIESILQRQREGGRFPIVAIASDAVPISLACRVPGHLWQPDVLHDECRAELMRQAQPERLVLTLEFDRARAIRSVSAQFHSQSDLSEDERTRLAPISDRQARRRLKISSAKGKVGRNDPCPCASGLKYKKCCLRNESR